MCKKFIFFVVGVFCVLITISSVFAEGPAIPAGTQATDTAASVPSVASQAPGLMGMLMPFLLMFGVIYLLIIRPQQKKLKEQNNLVNSLKHGDEVVTTSGILGKVAGITDKVVTLEVADDVRIKMVKTQVTQVLKGGQAKDLQA